MSSNVSNTSNETNTEVLRSEPEFSEMLRFVLYGIIICVSLIGNSAVCFVTYKEKRMRSFAYVLIANLAASDVAATLFLPFMIVYQHYSQWIFGDVMCKLVNPSVTVFALVTTNTLVAIACDRYRAMVFPFKLRPSTSETRMIIALTWMLAFLFTLPSYGSRTVTPDNYCIEIFTTDVEVQSLLSQLYSVFLFLTNNLIPLLVILVLHTQITMTLKHVSLIPQSFNLKRNSSLAGQDISISKPRDSVVLRNANAAAAHKRQEMEKKFIRMLLVVVLIFLFCYVPYQVFVLILLYRPDIYYTDRETVYYAYHYMHLLVWLPCALNPIIYAALNERYARAFASLFCGFRINAKRLSTAHSGTSYKTPNTVASGTKRKSSPLQYPPNSVALGSHIKSLRNQ